MSEHRHVCIICRQPFPCDRENCEFEPQYTVCDGESCVEEWSRERHDEGMEAL